MICLLWVLYIILSWKSYYKIADNDCRGLQILPSIRMLAKILPVVQKSSFHSTHEEFGAGVKVNFFSSLMWGVRRSLISAVIGLIGWGYSSGAVLSFIYSAEVDAVVELFGVELLWGLVELMFEFLDVFFVCFFFDVEYDVCEVGFACE